MKKKILTLVIDNTAVHFCNFNFSNVEFIFHNFIFSSRIVEKQCETIVIENSMFPSWIIIKKNCYQFYPQNFVDGKF